MRYSCKSGGGLGYYGKIGFLLYVVYLIIYDIYRTQSVRSLFVRYEMIYQLAPETAFFEMFLCKFCKSQHYGRAARFHVQSAYSVHIISLDHAFVRRFCPSVAQLYSVQMSSEIYDGTGLAAVHDTYHILAVKLCLLRFKECMYLSRNASLFEPFIDEVHDFILMEIGALYSD